VYWPDWKAGKVVVVVIAIFNCVVERLRMYRIVPFFPCNSTAFDGAVVTTRVISDVTCKTIHVHNTEAIRCPEIEKRLRDVNLTIVGIPYTETVALKSREMVNARVEEGNEVLWFVWSRKYPAKQDNVCLVAEFGMEIEDDPDVDPAIRNLFLIQLCAVK
jgi:hypothetical protein